MEITVAISSVEDLEKAIAILKDYGGECEAWMIKGTVWPKQKED